VSMVHHDCLRRWLVESADNPDSLTCKVCKQAYEVERGSQFSLTQGFTTKHWIGTAGVVFIMMMAAGGCWAAVQIYSEAYIKCLAVGLALLVQYICLRFLGLNTVTAYQRAKVYGLKIMNRGLNRNNNNHNVAEYSDNVTGNGGLVMSNSAEWTHTECSVGTGIKDQIRLEQPSSSTNMTPSEPGCSKYTNDVTADITAKAIGAKKSGGKKTGLSKGSSMNITTAIQLPSSKLATAKKSNL